MKSPILIAVLAALAVYNDAASIPEEVALYQEDIVQFQESGEEFQKDYYPDGATGRQRDDLILFYEESVHLTPIPYTVQLRDFVFRGNSTTEINRISVSNPPHVPGHTFIGNYRTHGRVRLTSVPGGELRSTVRFYGRYSDWLTD